MLTNVFTVLLLAASVTSKQDENKPASSAKDQDGASDRVTSILVQPGPHGPRHVILSDEHEVLPSVGDGFTSRAAGSFQYPSANYHPREDVEFHHTVPPPLHQVTYGPARPVSLRSSRPAQLYHHRFAPRGKIPHLKPAKEDTKALSEAIYKYSTYIKHGKGKEFARDGSSPEVEKPDYSVTFPEKESYHSPQYDSEEGLSAYRNREEEIKFRESIGDLYNDNFEKNDYATERKKPLPFSKLHFTKQYYIQNTASDNKYRSPVKSYNPYKNYGDEQYHDKPSGFDDVNGGKVVPVLAKFYKHPLPVIQTQLPADNVGLFIQYYPSHRSYEPEETSNNFFETPQEKANARSGNYHTSDSEWTPINAPDGAVPAKGYDIPAPDLSLGKVTPSKVFRRGSDSSGVVMGKSKQSLMSNQHIQGNSEGVVSAVVRVKQ